MCSFRSLKQARSRQGSRAYDVGVAKGATQDTSRMPWGWVNLGLIFIFGWTIPLRLHFKKSKTTINILWNINTVLIQILIHHYSLYADLVLKKHFLLLSSLLCCLIFEWKLWTFFRILCCSKEQHLFEIATFCYIVYVFTVTFDQFNASLLNKIIYKKNK